MSTGYGWEGLRQVCATLLGARHVQAPLRWLSLLGALWQMFTFTVHSTLPLPLWLIV